MRNKHILFSTVSCMIIFSFEVGAQCVMSQDCTALGYTQATSCVGGVKCPFGNKWDDKKKKWDDKKKRGNDNKIEKLWEEKDGLLSPRSLVT